MKSIDIIIPYVKGPDNGLELKYALRSIEKNFQHDNYRVIVAGEKPDWLNPDLFFPSEKIFQEKFRSFLDTLLKLYSVITEVSGSPEIIWTYDDIYFTKPVKLTDIRRLKAVAGFGTHPTHLVNCGAGGNWIKTLEYTMETVREAGGSNFNYETHLPRLFNRARILKLFREYSLFEKPMMISSLYFNLYNKDQQPITLINDNPGIRFLLRSVFDYENLKKRMSNHLFTNNAPLSWTPVLKRVLLEMFPQKSRFEL